MSGLGRCGIYIHTMEYYSAIIKNKIMPFAATWMELESLILSEVSQRQISYIIYTWTLKNNTSESTYKIETDSQTQKTNLWLPRGQVEGGWTGGWDWHMHTEVYGMIG